MPPDTSTYLYVAYTVAAAIYGVYSLSLWRRRRRVREQLRRLGTADAP